MNDIGSRIHVRLAATALLMLAHLSAASAQVSVDDSDKIAKLIRQLGSDDFSEREAAFSRLATIGEPALELLGEAAKSDDDEIKYRAKLLIGKVIPDAGKRKFQGHSGPVTCVACSPDGRFVATGSWDRTLRVWDLNTGREKSRLSGHSRSIWTVAFSPDSKKVLSGGEDSTIQIWDVESGKLLRTLRGHRKGTTVATLVAFRGDRALSASWDRTVRQWDLSTGREMLRIDLKTVALRICVTPDGKQALLGGLDGSVSVRDLKTGKETHRLTGHKNAVWAVSISPDGRYAVTGSGRDFKHRAKGSYSVRLWDLATGKELRQFKGHTDGIRSVAFSADGKRLLTGSLDQTARLWETSTGKELRCFKGHSAAVECVSFVPKRPLAITSSFDGSVRLWRLPSDKK
jgi:WD40 repeat protein